MKAILIYTSYFNGDTPSSVAHVFSSIERAKEELLEQIAYDEKNGAVLAWISDDERRAMYKVLGRNGKRVLYNVVLTVYPAEEIYD